MTEEVRRQLVQAAGLGTEDQEALIHLEALGVSVQKAKGAASGGGKGCVRACVGGGCGRACCALCVCLLNWMTSTDR